MIGLDRNASNILPGSSKISPKSGNIEMEKSPRGAQRSRNISVVHGDHKNPFILSANNQISDILENGSIDSIEKKYMSRNTSGITPNHQRNNSMQ